MATDSKVALMTGAARGIGLAATKKFLAEGWRVALLDIERTMRSATRGLRCGNSRQTKDTYAG